MNQVAERTECPIFTLSEWAYSKLELSPGRQNGEDSQAEK